MLLAPVIATLLVLSVAIISGQSLSGSVTYVDGVYTFLPGAVDRTAAAYGSFADTLNTTGWGVLRVSTSSAYDDDVQMFAAGYLEGVLSAPRIHQMSHISNIRAYGGRGIAPAEIIRWFDENDQFINNMIQQHTNDRIWSAIKLIVSQYNGLQTGYNSTLTSSKYPLSDLDFKTLQARYDLYDIYFALNISIRPNFTIMSSPQIKNFINNNSHCSVLIKISNDYHHLYSAQVMWTSYNSLNRIYKHYYFNLNKNMIAAKGISFSSYPGVLASLDDFYIMSNNLVALETTNTIFNNDLYNYITSKALLSWFRVRIANMLANNGEDWYNIIRQYNSGTYNNQYIIINYNLFIPKQPLLLKTLYIIEQIPGLVTAHDVTRQLERGYFPSYNIPYDDYIYNISGYPDIINKLGYNQSYSLASRARIFRRDHSHVTDLTSFLNIMRYNNYLNDPYSANSSIETICARGDLADPTDEGAWGCIDGKATSDVLLKTGASYAIAGPTTNNGMLPAFDWSQYPDTPRDGQPDRWDFDWQFMDAGWNNTEQQEEAPLSAAN